MSRKPPKPLKIEEYFIENEMDVDDDILDYDKAIRALFAKVNELIAHSQEQERIINSLIKKYDTTTL